MIESIRFGNFKALQNTSVPLGPFTLIVGLSGSGKSTAMQAVRFFRNPRNYCLHGVSEAEPRNRDCGYKMRFIL